jgi:hypothetical protein
MIIIVRSGMLIICGFSFPVFFLQLYAVANGIGQEFSLYCVRNVFLNTAGLPTDRLHQLPIMNAASILGRIFPPMLVPRFGVVNLGILCLMSMATLIFCLPAVTSGGAMITFSILYGFFSGGGMSESGYYTLRPFGSDDIAWSEVALTPAMLGVFFRVCSANLI